MRTVYQNLLIILASAILLSLSIFLQYALDQRGEGKQETINQLRLLPRGEVLKPALLGFHHLGADIIWLHIIQVIGERVITVHDYEWLNHALDVMTTLDPQYVYAYDVGGTVLAEMAQRVDWSNQLLEKGYQANPQAWRLPFVLGFNHFFHLHNYVKAGEYMGKAAQIPGRPYYVDTLAARLYVEGGSPTLALQYLEAMLQNTTDRDLRAVYEQRYREVVIMRDLQILEQAIGRYNQVHGRYPGQLGDVVTAGFLARLPEEPFGGEYRLNPKTGEVSSSTHPERLRLYRPSDHHRITNLKKAHKE